MKISWRLLPREARHCPQTSSPMRRWNAGFDDCRRARRTHICFVWLEESSMFRMSFGFDLSQSSMQGPPDLYRHHADRWRRLSVGPRDSALSAAPLKLLDERRKRLNSEKKSPVS